MKRVLVIFALMFCLGIAFQAHAIDRLFLHDGDSITLKNTTGDPVEFQVYSISGRSRIDYTGPGCGGKLIFRNTDGWQTIACSGGMVTITIRETGGAPQGDIPGDSDVVVRYGSGVKESNLKHCDDNYKGKKCNTCGKVLIW